MRILFVAKHASGDNDDEGAIAYALQQLGHVVTCVHEMRKHRRTKGSVGDEIDQRWQDFDLCLFLKWGTVSEIVEVAKRLPCAFWYFDMVRSVADDPSLKARSDSRIQWMRDVTPYVVAGFCTDGDWVEFFNTTLCGGVRILRHLMQGADERMTGFGKTPNAQHVPILFTGMKHHGRERASHIDHLAARWGSKFHMFGDGGPRRRIHGREMADVMADAEIIVAPNGPSTDRYWSNRVYLTLGFGGFLLHPYCEGLLKHYSATELMTYKSWEECDELISLYLRSPQERLSYQWRGYNRTIESNLYQHRCAELIEVVKERM